jgi:predicted AAA+ superfamily ATPase
LLAPVLDRAARAMPVVVVTGARQTGKTTLLRDLQAAGPRTYLSLDDLDTLGQARDAPADLLARAPRLVLDEVQRAPELLLAVKQSVDRDRRAGQFILTGSANLLLARTVSESLAGRATYTTLWPLTRREQLGQAAAGRWDDLLAAPEREWADVLAASPAEPEDWRALARRGGFPTPAILAAPWWTVM